MAAGTSEMPNPLFAFVLELGIINKGSIGVGGGLLFFQSDQIAGDVFRILRRESQAGHHGHVLDL